MINLFNNTFLFSLILFSVICQGQTTINASIQHEGLQREYILYVPANYTGQTDVPLLFNFHGYTSNANQQMFYGDFRSIADTVGFIIIHPQGSRDNIDNTHFNVGWGGSSVDDVGFTNALIDSIASDYAIDQKRIYSTGMSNGGFMSYLLACELSDRIAAVASVTGSMSPSQFNACNPQRAVPVLEIHGTADGVVPYEVGFIAKSIDDVLNYWADHNNCEMIPSVETLPDIDMTDGSTVAHFVYADGNQGSSVEHFKIIGGGHTWPGNSISGAGTNYDIDASEEVWRFFSQFDIDGAIVSGAEEEIIFNQVLVYPNPVKEKINISSNQLIDYVKLFSSNGELIQERNLNASEVILDMKDYPSGLYYLLIDNSIRKVLFIH